MFSLSKITQTAMGVVSDGAKSVGKAISSISTLNNTASSALTKAQAMTKSLYGTGNTQGFNRIAFPVNVGNDGNGNIIRFQMSLPSGSKYLSSGEYKSAVDPKTGQKQSSTYREEKSNSIKRKFSSAYTKTTTYIDLYMPDHIQTSYGSNWGTTDLGIVGALIDGGMALGEVSEDNLGPLLKEVAQNTLKESSIDMASGAIQSGSEALSSYIKTPVLRPKDGIRAVRSNLKNPYTEVIFNGVQNRTFSFTFKMIPKNEEEQTIIQNIIKEFKFHGAPEMRYENQNNYMTFPSEVDIQFIHRTVENPWLFKISTCAITNVSVNHSPEGQYSSHSDGSPFATELTVSFTELETLSKERIKENY